MEKFKTELSQTEISFGVDRTVITAIILVETRLGTFLGNTSIFNTLSTLASLEDSDTRNMLWDVMSNSEQLKRIDALIYVALTTGGTDVDADFIVRSLKEFHKLIFKKSFIPLMWVKCGSRVKTL